jgi:hypothetical protein
MSLFDNQSGGFTAEGERFKATVTQSASGLVWKAKLEYKTAPQQTSRSFNSTPRSTFKYSGAESITAVSAEAMRAALRRIDPNVQFFAGTSAPGQRTALGTPIGKVSDKDAAMLEAMRVDVANVSDASYASACRQMGTKPQARPDKELPYKIVSPYTPEEQKHLNSAFLGSLYQLHPELRNDGEQGNFNAALIAQWHADEGLDIFTERSLTQAYNELSNLQNFRTDAVGVRKRGTTNPPVHSYSRAEVLAFRRGMAGEPEPAAAPIAQGSPEDVAARARVLKLAREHVRNTQPQLKPNSGEYNKAVDQILKEWAVESNPSIGKQLQARNLVTHTAASRR